MTITELYQAWVDSGGTYGKGEKVEGLVIYICNE